LLDGQRPDCRRPASTSADETFDVGKDAGSPVSNDYQSPNPYTGTLRKVEVNLQPTNHTENDIKLIRKAERDAWFARE
jgi:arylsulfatase